ncbi:MAG: MATE family efflux transporter [Oscillospiraceae bacterium]|nr:MATE family efflux transporter [Oscillospiraceae bacterium]
MNRENARGIRDMTRGSTLRCILFFAFPLMLGNAFQQIYTLTDTAVVGRVLGVTALAALGACDLLVWTVSSAIQAFTGGFSIRMANAFGAGDRARLHRTIATSAALSAIAGFGLCLLMELCAPAILHLMQVQPEVFPYALLYLRILYAGVPFVTLYNYFFAILRALGNSRDPFRAMLLSSGLNILLDLLFVAVLGLGIGSAAFATIFSQGVSALYSFRKVRRLLPEDRSHLRFDRSLVGHLLSLSGPMAGQLIISAGGGLVIQAVVNTYEVAFIAGYTATYKLFGLLEMAAISYGQAITTYTGQNLGAGQIVRIRRGLWISESVALVTALLLSLVIFLAGEPIIRLFISGTEEEIARAVPSGLTFLRLMGLWLLALYTNHLCGSFVQGLGKAVLPTVNSVCEMLTRALSVTVFRAALGPRCVFYAEPLAWITGALILGVSALLFLRRLEKVD